MSILKKISAGTLTLVLATGLAGGTLAQNSSNTTTVEIGPMTEGGNLSVSIDNLDFGSHEYSLQNQTVTGSILVSAADLRGEAEGWNVTITGTDFAPEFRINNLSLSTSTVDTTSSTGHSSEAQPIQAGVTGVSDAAATTVLTAVPETGAGQYNAQYDASLNIPAGTLVGEYDATLTVTITGAGPGEVENDGGN